MPRRKLLPPAEPSTEAMIRLCQQMVKTHYQCQLSMYEHRLARFETIHWPLMNEIFYRRIQSDPDLADNPDAIIRATIDWVEKTVR